MEDWKPKSVQAHFRQYPKGLEHSDTWTARMNYFHNIAGWIEKPDRSLEFQMLKDLNQ